MMVRKVLHLRGVSLDMLKQARAATCAAFWRSIAILCCAWLFLHSFGFLGAITVSGARLGSDIIAVNAVLMTLTHLYGLCADGFAYAVEAHLSAFYGARR